MNPYEADPSKIPGDDPYRDEPLYGRYHAQASDFKPDPRYVLSDSAETIQYWKSVLQQCNETNRVYENDEDGRDVFALGGVIVKSNHLKTLSAESKADRDYSFVDANEVKAVEIARRSLTKSCVKVPHIYFAERIPGVGLNVAWRYLSTKQKVSFKQQARILTQTLRQVQCDPSHNFRSYIAPDPDPVKHKGIQTLEYDILFKTTDSDTDRSFAQNDFSTSNTIVEDDKIVGLVGWEMAGWFGVKTAAQVHLQIRTPRRENFTQLLANGNLSEERLQDILFWNDLYDGLRRSCCEGPGFVIGIEQEPFGETVRSSQGYEPAKHTYSFVVGVHMTRNFAAATAMPIEVTNCESMRG